MSDPAAGRYRVDPTGVATVLRATRREAVELQTELEPLLRWLRAAITDAGSSPAITGAVVELMDDHSTRLTSVATRTGAALGGAYDATVAYAHGDAAMAERYQRLAVEGADGTRARQPQKSPR